MDSISMNLANFPVCGASIGSYGTCIELPSLSLAFDIGRCPESVVNLKTVLITHGHIDHVGGVAHHCARRQLKGLTPPTYVMERGLVERFQAFMEAARALDGSRMLCNIVEIDPEDAVGIKLPTLPDRYTLRAFRSHHSRPTIGYILLEERKRLRVEFQGRDGRKLLELKKEGVEIMEEFDHPVLAFTGDTRPSVLESVPDLLRTDLLIMEITFIDQEITPRDAWETGHTHLEHIRAMVGLFTNKAVLFTHRSARYTPAEYREAIESLPEPLAGKCKALLGRFHPGP